MRMERQLMTAIALTVNGKRKSVEVEPRHLLADVLRHQFGCYGVHFGCSHGSCGCCTVVVDGVARLACLTFAVQCDGSIVATIEGFGEKTLHPLQQAFVEHHGFQCGYCTPGFIMALQQYVERADNPSDEEIREAMSGNICRCTGYQGILEAVRAAIAERKSRP
jgi:carbon-monoxide dehydrogenase small subunit